MSESKQEHFVMDTEERRLELVLLRAVARTRWSSTSEHVIAARQALDDLADAHGSLAHLLATLDQSLADDDYPRDESGALLKMENKERYEVDENGAHMIWVTRTVRDVRTSDFIRMPGREGTERVVNAVSPPLGWHVHPGSNPRYPTPAEWTEIRLTLDGNTFSFAPDMPVEIELEEAELVAIEALGWENRV